MTTLSAGEIVGGKYRVDWLLGRGAMGAVYGATNTLLGHRVALKVILPSAASHPAAVRRFLREAQAAVRIQSEHVARVMDVGQLEGGVPFIVLEYLEGADLQSVVAHEGPLQVADAAAYLIQACDALAEAHSLGIVHRDLKPSNLFVANRTDGSRIIKVLDFGISKVSDDEGGALTASQSLLGSPGYMSPEQVRSPKNVDVRTDVWALGVTLYEILSARPPFGDDAPSAILARVVMEEPESLAKHAPLTPAALRAVVDKCLCKDLSCRYQSVAELAEGLLPFAAAPSTILVERIRKVLKVQTAQVPVVASIDHEPQPGTAQPPSDPTAAQLAQTRLVSGAAGQTANSWAGTASQQRPSKLVLASAVCGALCVLAGAAAVVWRITTPARQTSGAELATSPGSVQAAPSASQAPVASSQTADGPGSATVDAQATATPPVIVQPTAISALSSPGTAQTTRPPASVPVAVEPGKVPAPKQPAGNDDLDLGKRR